jgi:hypothetical protein
LDRRGQRLVGVKKVREQCAGVCIKRFGDLNEFNDIQPALPAFILGDKGLRAIEPFSNIGLRELPGFPDFG